MQTRDDLLLERFFDRTLTPEEKSELDARLAADPALADTLRWQNKLSKAFRHSEAQAMKSLLQTEEQKLHPKMTVSWLRPQNLMAAAAVLVVALAAIWFFNQPPSFSEKELAFAPHVNTFTERGRGAPSSSDIEGVFRVRMHEALIAYDTFNYVDAEKALRQVPTQTEDQRMTVLFYRGVCLSGQGNYAEAISVLKTVAEKDSGYQAPALWYLAMAYLKVGKYSEAEVALTQYTNHPDGRPKRDSASLFLKKLR